MTLFSNHIQKLNLHILIYVYMYMQANRANFIILLIQTGIPYDMKSDYLK